MSLVDHPVYLACLNVDILNISFRLLGHYQMKMGLVRSGKMRISGSIRVQLVTRAVGDGAGEMTYFL